MNQAFIKSLNNEDLLISTERIIEQERKIVQVLIWHLQEIQDRKLYLSLGYESLYECLIEHFKMSDTTAYGRIKVLKILEEVPEVSESLKSGELNISNIALAHSFIEKHEKLTGEELSQSDKAEIFEKLKDKTTRQAKEFFARCNPETALPHDEINPVTETHFQIRSTVNRELVEKINYVKSLISHENINPTHEELLSLALDALIEKVEKKKGINALIEKEKGLKPQSPNPGLNPKPPTQSFTDRTPHGGSKDEISPQTTKANENPLPAPRNEDSRYVPRDIKRTILKRAKNQCEHIHINGERCQSKFQLQFDHIIAYSKGGKTTLENMQLLCRVHNAAKNTQ